MHSMRLKQFLICSMPCGLWIDKGLLKNKEYPEAIGMYREEGNNTKNVLISIGQCLQHTLPQVKNRRGVKCTAEPE